MTDAVCPRCGQPLVVNLDMETTCSNPGCSYAGKWADLFCEWCGGSGEEPGERGEVKGPCEYCGGTGKPKRGGNK